MPREDIDAVESCELLEWPLLMFVKRYKECYIFLYIRKNKYKCLCTFFEMSLNRRSTSAAVATDFPCQDSFEYDTKLLSYLNSTMFLSKTRVNMSQSNAFSLLAYSTPWKECFGFEFDVSLKAKLSFIWLNRLLCLFFCVKCMLIMQECCSCFMSAELVPVSSHCIQDQMWPMITPTTAGVHPALLGENQQPNNDH